jgi:hypothetical protein
MTATEDEKAKALEAMPGDEGDFFFKAGRISGWYNTHKETLVKALAPAPVAGDLGEGLKKLEVIKRVLDMASKDVRPSEPLWHCDFLSMAVKRIEEVQDLIAARNVIKLKGE